MTPFVRVTAATGLALAALLCASPSFATDTREAIKACDANPKCKFDVKADGVVISVGGELITCPVKNGPCTVMHIVAPTTIDFGVTNALQFRPMQMATAG